MKVVRLADAFEYPVTGHFDMRALRLHNKETSNTVDYVILLVGFAEHPEEIDRKRAEAAHAERVRYNRAYYSLDCDDGIEYSACVHEPSPQELLERMDRFCHLWNALNSLPEIQGRRVDAHLILGKSYREIARDEGVDKSAVRNSVLCGIEAMKKYLRKNL